MVEISLDAGVTRQFREFRVVRDNRINQNENRVTKPSVKNSVAVSNKEPLISNVSEKRLLLLFIFYFLLKSTVIYIPKINF